ncbi:MAG: hypothetical protein A2754_00320 [Candidatus Magasanikbacteria bacterium RIFCSPHIGHO2_01_FULL_47_8]|uniref:Uncharacterized protein n=1 Tax=Candidatus Magasanikbacteria bacterium RIFCSPHIGHO2_01_FULL_47_8 TaxID=1798673 RepID=A0A1F6MDG6_9BACT|nr:MAG: hypothetical protein A2754_00320 [Candidatus Magasanikbacteria bacterium RIFCSPHIGHO2_01_FULL_47_8]
MSGKKGVPKKTTEAAGTPEPTAPPIPQAGYDQTAKRWMWVGVGTLATIILVLWGWSMRLQFAFFSSARSPEGVLVDKTKANWNKIFSENKQKQIEGDTVREQLKNIITQIVTSSTQPTATTTTVSTTASSTGQ